MKLRMSIMLKIKVVATFDRLQIETRCVPDICKLIFVKLSDSIVHKRLGIESQYVGLLISTIVSILEKDDDLVALIINNRMVYAKEVCTPKHEKHGPFKAR